MFFMFIVHALNLAANLYETGLIQMNFFKARTRFYDFQLFFFFEVGFQQVLFTQSNIMSNTFNHEDDPPQTLSTDDLSTDVSGNFGENSQKNHKKL